jgi:hypothetical protein
MDPLPTACDPHGDMPPRQFTLANLMSRVTLACILLTLPHKYFFVGLWAMFSILQIWDHRLSAIPGLVLGAATGLLIMVALLREPVLDPSTWPPILFFGVACSLAFTTWKDGWFKYRGIW